MAVSLADIKRMLFLDTRMLEYEKLALPENAELLVSDTGFARSLAKSKYNERRTECATASNN